MHYTQNDKIRQATEGTIVVGVDIGSEKNYARAFRGNGIEITRKAFFFPNTLTGFKAFDEWVTKLVVPLAEKKIIVGVEPTAIIPVPQSVLTGMDSSFATQRDWISSMTMTPR